MTCACGKPKNPDKKIIGIMYAEKNVPALILFDCPCKSTLAIRWAEATEPQRAAARLAELSRDAASEMTYR